MTGIRAGLGALAYLERRVLLNRLRVLVHDPKRLLAWSLFLLPALFSLLTFRLVPSNAARIAIPPQALEVVAAVVPGAFGLLVGLKILGAGRRAPLGFTSPADGPFLSGSALPPRLVVFWLQMRHLVGYGFAAVLSGAFTILLIGAAGMRSGPAVFFLLTLALGGALVFALPLPILILSRRGARLHVLLLGSAVAVAGAAWITLGVLQLVAAPIPADALAALQTLPPGSWILASIRGHASGLMALFIADSLVVALTVVAGSDIYPELWESSRRGFVIRHLLGRGALMWPGELRRALKDAGVEVGRGPARSVKAPATTATRVPGGAWVLLWKDWVALQRLPGGISLPAGIVAAGIVTGGILGELVQRGYRDAAFAAATIIGGLLLTASLGPAIRLAPDLRNPLWWLSAAPLRMRLLVWTISGSLKQFIPLAAGLVAAAAVTHAPVWLGFLPIAFAALWAMRAIGLGAYAVLPTPVDLRGPGLFLRLLIMEAMLIPVAAGALIAGLLTGNAVIASITAIAIMLGEGWVLILFAEWRLAGNGLAFTQAERR
jgi:hypothetical protein